MNAMVKETSTALAERAPMALTVAERAIKVFEALPDVDSLQKLAKTSASIVAITNQAGYDQCHSARMALKNMRLEIARTGEEGRDDAVKTSKAIIAWQKSLIAVTQPEEERLGAIQEAWDARIKAAKEAAIQAEIQRVAALQERIAELRGNQILTPASGSALILEHIEDLEKIPVDETFEEFEQQAADAKTAAIFRLNSIRAAAVAHEADRAELIKLRAAEDERQRVAREAQAKADADAKTERDRLEAIAKQEREAEAAKVAEANRIEREKIAAEAAENQRIAAERQAEIGRQAEAQRLANAAEAKRIVDDRAKFEAEQEAARIAAQPKPRKRKAHVPAEQEILHVLESHYSVSTETVRGWLSMYNWKQGVAT